MSIGYLGHRNELVLLGTPKWASALGAPQCAPALETPKLYILYIGTPQYRVSICFRDLTMSICSVFNCFKGYPTAPRYPNFTSPSFCRILIVPKKQFRYLTVEFKSMFNWKRKIFGIKVKIHRKIHYEAKIMQTFSLLNILIYFAYF